jgi:hypothetical protein
VSTITDSFLAKLLPGIHKYYYSRYLSKIGIKPYNFFFRKKPAKAKMEKVERLKDTVSF